MITNKTPLVSILMVVYNSSEFLDEAISSVLDQDYKNIELIICDDCSTDASLEIIKKYKDSRIVLKQNKANLGEYNNRHQAMNMATGAYFIFVDGDDVMIDGNGLQTAVNYLEEHSNVGFGIVRPEEELNGEKVVIKTSDRIYHDHFLGRSQINYSFARNIFRTSTVKRDFKAFPKGVISGDDFLRLKLALQNEVMLLETPFAKWRKRPNQATSRKALTVKGNLEPYMINNYFLFEGSNLFNTNDFKAAKSRLLKKQVKHALSALRHGKYKLSKTLLKCCQFYFGENKGKGLSNYQKLL